MIKKQRSKLLKPIAERLGLPVSANLAYKIISHNDFKILLGLLFGGCSNKNAFRPYYYGSCLFSPDSDNNLSFGNSICYPVENYPIDNRLTDFWTVKSLSQYEDRIESAMKRFLSSITSFEDYLRALLNKEFPFYGAVELKLEISGYINIILGNSDKAMEYFKIIMGIPNPNSIPWRDEQKAIISRMMDCIRRGDYQSIYKQLHEWQNEALEKLKINNQ